jgi:alkane 1-monooxygenase
MNWRAFKYALPLLMYISAVRTFTHTGFAVWITLIIAFVIIPLFELVLKPGTYNATDAEEEMMRADRIYDWLLYMVVPLQYLALYIFLSNMDDSRLSLADKAGRILTMGLFCGIFGINVGHELGHRVKKYEQFLAKSLLLTSLYTHFYIEHNRGHHRHVATPNDPSSAPYRMSLYGFWLRSIKGVYAGAWHIANDEMRRKHLPAFGFRNEMLQLQLLQLMFCIFIYLLFGGWGLVYFLLAVPGGILLLETVNYIEHYGLRRNQRMDGKFERAMPSHSWNSNHIIGRLFLFELSRHSDHHFSASRKYQVLRHHENAPQLPAGYPGSMILATLPPLWFWVMDRQMKKYHLLPEQRVLAS